MTTCKLSTLKFVICIDNSEYPASLEMHKIYRVLPDEDVEQDGDLRIINESGEDYLYPADYFVLVDLPCDTAYVLNKSFVCGLQHTDAEEVKYGKIGF